MVLIYNTESIEYHLWYQYELKSSNILYITLSPYSTIYSTSMEYSTNIQY